MNNIGIRQVPLCDSASFTVAHHRALGALGHDTAARADVFDITYCDGFPGHFRGCNVAPCAVANDEPLRALGRDAAARADILDIIYLDRFCSYVGHVRLCDSRTGAVAHHGSLRVLGYDTAVRAAVLDVAHYHGGFGCRAESSNPGRDDGDGHTSLLQQSCDCQTASLSRLHQWNHNGSWSLRSDRAKEVQNIAMCRTAAWQAGTSLRATGMPVLTVGRPFTKKRERDAERRKEELG